MIPSSSRSRTPHGDCFDRLPPELCCDLLDFLSLEDIHSLVRASPAAHFYFSGNRGHVLRFHRNHIHDHYGDDACLRLAILAIRLRSIRAKCRYHTVVQAEKQVKPILESILLMEFNQPHNGWERTLSGLIVTKNLIPELRDAFSAYRDRYNGLNSQPISLPTQTLGNIPRATSRKFIECFLRFDCYCNIFYHHRGFMFRHTADVGQIFFEPFSSESDIDHHLEKYLRRGQVLYYTIVNYITYSHRVLLKSVDETLGPRRSRPANTPLDRDSGMEGLHVLQFLKRSENEEIYYLNHLCLQGYPLLLFLQQLNPQALEGYTVHNFCEVVARPQAQCKWPELKHYRELQLQWG